MIEPLAIQIKIEGDYTGNAGVLAWGATYASGYTTIKLAEVADAFPDAYKVGALIPWGIGDITGGADIKLGGGIDKKKAITVSIAYQCLLLQSLEAAMAPLYGWKIEIHAIDGVNDPKTIFTGVLTGRDLKTETEFDLTIESASISTPVLLGDLIQSATETKMSPVIFGNMYENEATGMAKYEVTTNTIEKYKCSDVGTDDETILATQSGYPYWIKTPTNNTKIRITSTIDGSLYISDSSNFATLYYTGGLVANVILLADELNYKYVKIYGGEDDGLCVPIKRIVKTLGVGLTIEAESIKTYDPAINVSIEFIRSEYEFKTDKLAKGFYGVANSAETLSPVIYTVDKTYNPLLSYLNATSTEISIPTEISNNERDVISITPQKIDANYVPLIAGNPPIVNLTGAPSGDDFVNGAFSNLKRGSSAGLIYINNATATAGASPSHIGFDIEEMNSNLWATDRGYCLYSFNGTPSTRQVVLYVLEIPQEPDEYFYNMDLAVQCYSMIDGVKTYNRIFGISSFSGEIINGVVNASYDNTPEGSSSIGCNQTFIRGTSKSRYIDESLYNTPPYFKINNYVDEESLRVINYPLQVDITKSINKSVLGTAKTIIGIAFSIENSLSGVYTVKFTPYGVEKAKTCDAIADTIFIPTIGRKHWDDEITDVLTQAEDIAESIKRCEIWDNTDVTNGYKTNADINTGTSYGGFECNPVIQKIGVASFQLEESKAKSDDALLMLSREHNMMLYDDKDGKFSLGLFDRLEGSITMRSIAQADIIGAPDINKYFSSDNIICEPVLSYNYDIGFERFKSTIEVTNVDKATYQDSYVAGINSTGDYKESIWELFKSLYTKVGKKIKQSSNSFEFKTIKDEQTAYAWLWRYGLMCDSDKLTIQVPYEDWYDVTFGEHIMVNLKFHTSNADRELIVTDYRISRKKAVVTITGVLLSATDLLTTPRIQELPLTASKKQDVDLNATKKQGV
jgi:hypothetical protein